MLQLNFASNAYSCSIRGRHQGSGVHAGGLSKGGSQASAADSMRPEDTLYVLHDGKGNVVMPRTHTLDLA